MNEITSNYIYLLHEREFIRTNENIYKVGMSRQSNLSRFNNYPKGSRLIFQHECNDCRFVESIILCLFKGKFHKCNEYGNEYFQGDKKCMIDIIYIIIGFENEIRQQHITTRSEYIESVLVKHVEKYNLLNTQIEHSSIETLNTNTCKDCVTNSNNTSPSKNNNVNVLFYCGTPIAASPNTKFSCKKCHFYTNKISNYNEHLLTKKHKIITIAVPAECPSVAPPAVPDPAPSNTEEMDKPSLSRKTYNCKTCNKPYFSKKGVWQHSKKCQPLPAPIPKPESLDKTTMEVMTATMMEMYKTNQTQMLQLFTAVLTNVRPNTNV